MEKIISINIKSIVAKVNEMIEAITLMAGRHEELAMAQNELKKEIDSIEIPKPQNLEAVMKRIESLEDKPEPPKIEKYDDSAMLGKLTEIEESIESLDKRLDFVKRTYSEKWSSIQFDKASYDKMVKGRFEDLESEIKDIKNLVCDVTKQKGVNSKSLVSSKHVKH